MTTPIRVLRSPVIPAGFVHGFPERTGGVSTGARASLNLGKRWGDDPELVDRNRALLAAHAGFDVDDLQMMRHVHGTNVWRVGEPLPEYVELRPVPSHAEYRYGVVNDQRVIVEPRSRKIIRIIE